MSGEWRVGSGEWGVGSGEWRKNPARLRLGGLMVGLLRKPSDFTFPTITIYH